MDLIFGIVILVIAIVGFWVWRQWERYHDHDRIITEEQARKHAAPLTSAVVPHKPERKTLAETTERPE